MITTAEKEQIRYYLSKKGLPFDLLLEIEDHFITQIEDFCAAKEWSFDDAFQRTKILWKDDLKLVFPWYVLNRVGAGTRTVFETKMVRKVQKSFFIKAVLLMLCWSVILFGVAKLLKQNWFVQIFRLQFIFPLFFVFLSTLYVAAKYKLFGKKFQGFKFSIYGGSMSDAVLVCSIYPLPIYFFGQPSFTDLAIALYDFVSLGSSMSTSYAIDLGIIFMSQILGVYLMLKQIKAIKVFRSMKNELKTI